MNSNYASYIFENEVLYKFKKETSVPKQENKVVEEKPEFKEEKKIEPSFYSKDTLILTGKLKEEELNFLNSILKAVNLDLSKVDLVDVHSKIPILHKNNLTTKFLSFGIPISSLHPSLKFEKFKPSKVKTITFLEVPFLEVIMKNSENEKVNLWSNLQGIYLKN